MTTNSSSALNRRIRSHSVFVYDVDQTGHGSGVLIELAKRIFVLSAHHVIEGDVDINLGIVPHQSRFTVLEKWTDAETDIGFLELKASEVHFRMSEYSAAFPVGPRKAHSIPSKKTTFALCGFPDSMSRETPRGREFLLTYVAVSILAPEQWPADFATRHDPSMTFLIPYGEKRSAKFFDADGNQSEPVKPRGMSGCGLWHYDTTSQDDDKPRYSLAGILHHYDPIYQVLVGTLIDPLIFKIAAHCGIQLETLP